MSKIVKIQNKIEKDKSIVNYNTDELQYLKKPIGKTLYLSSEIRPQLIEKKDKYFNDILLCNVCKKKYRRSYSGKHKKTKYHQLCEKISKNMINFIFNFNDIKIESE